MAGEACLSAVDVLWGGLAWGDMVGWEAFWVKHDSLATLGAVCFTPILHCVYILNT